MSQNDGNLVNGHGKQAHRPTMQRTYPVSWRADWWRLCIAQHLKPKPLANELLPIDQSTHATYTHAAMMPEVQYNPQGAVWKYTYAEGPESGRVFFHSPQRHWSDQRASLVLRQVNSTDENKVWINTDPSLVVRCDELNSFPTPEDAHGVIICSGLARSLSPSHRQITHHRGERIWVEHSINPECGPNGLIPVISLDTLEHFEIPHRHICFVAQVTRFDAFGGQYYGTPVGPARNRQPVEPQQHQSRQQSQCSQAYVEWPVSKPQLACFQWHPSHSDAGEDASSSLHGLQLLESVEERRRLFQTNWVVVSQHLQAPTQPGEENDAIFLSKSSVQAGKQAVRKNPEESQASPESTSWVRVASTQSNLAELIGII
ncbi:unnamed protein product [Clonostachys byssicola]|uniref:Uncharacterized protein n=1 Tax=Clonostachys byssicola TaxID=160290 RepID=A0A9N9Y9J6_9HYPO|nr:unnamed protein product [Clonostachys byssicola]